MSGVDPHHNLEILHHDGNNHNGLHQNYDEDGNMIMEGNGQRLGDSWLELAKKNRNAKKKGLEVDHETAEQMAMNITDAMIKAYNDDVHAYMEKKPAIYKLRMVDEMVEECNKKYIQRFFENVGILQAWECWLRFAPDGALPNIKIRTAIYTILQKLLRERKINYQNLRGTQLGHRLVEAWKHPDETKQNKQQIRELIELIVAPIDNGDI